MRVAGALDRLIEGLLHALGRQVLEAAQVTQGTGAGEAGTAGQTQGDSQGAIIERRGVVGVRGPEDRHERFMEARRDVHEARVIAHHGVRPRHEVHGLEKRRAPGEIGACVLREFMYRMRDLAVTGAAEQQDLPAAFVVAARKAREVAGRPALRGTIFGARAECEEGGVRIDSEPLGALPSGLVIGDQAWPRGRGERLAGLEAQEQEAVDGLQFAARGFAANVVDESVAGLAEIAGTALCAARPCRQCRLVGSRQDIGLRVIAFPQPATEPQSFTQGEPAMRDGERDGVGDLGHARGERQGCRRGYEVQGAIGMARLQELEQAMGHDHVTHPGRSHDQRPRGAHRPSGSSFMSVRT